MFGLFFISYYFFFSLSLIQTDIRCKNLNTKIQNGHVDILPYNQFGAIAKYTCAEGFKLFGKDTRICQGDETWSGEPPRCVINDTYGEMPYQGVHFFPKTLYLFIYLLDLLVACKSMTYFFYFFEMFIIHFLHVFFSLHAKMKNKNHFRNLPPNNIFQGFSFRYPRIL